MRLAYRKDQVKDAPRAEADGQLTPSEEEALYAHYGRPTAETASGTVRSDTSRSSDDAMTRSEEEVGISKTTRETGRARLRKWVETEDVHMTVPIRREKAILVTEPITGDNIDEAMAGEDITEAEHEVVLTEEVVDVEKRVVPKERVRVDTEVETDEVVVDEEIRKERIDFEDDTR